jgi:hypothetical protein
MLGYYAVVAVAAAALMIWANGQPHAAPSAEAEGGPTVVVPIAVGQALAHFPASDVAGFRAITQDTLTKLQTGDQGAATARIADLETSWDDAQPKLQALDDTTWTAIDGRIDTVLTAMRDPHPDSKTEEQALNELLTALN